MGVSCIFRSGSSRKSTLLGLERLAYPNLPQMEIQWHQSVSRMSLIWTRLTTLRRRRERFLCCIGTLTVARQGSVLCRVGGLNSRGQANLDVRPPSNLTTASIVNYNVIYCPRGWRSFFARNTVCLFRANQFTDLYRGTTEINAKRRSPSIMTHI
jgi:hypothetical protein